MKNSIFTSFAMLTCCFCLVICLSSKAQQALQSPTYASTDTPDTMLSTPEPGAGKHPATHAALQPDFKAGQHKASFNGLHEYAAAHLSYPELARDNSIEGKVAVIVEISPKGKVINAVISKSLGYGCDKAVLDMLYHMPDWKPAMNYGIPVKSKQGVDFNFRLSGD